MWKIKASCLNVDRWLQTFFGSSHTVSLDISKTSLDTSLLDPKLAPVLTMPEPEATFLNAAKLPVCHLSPAIRGSFSLTILQLLHQKIHKETC